MGYFTIFLSMFYILRTFNFLNPSYCNQNSFDVKNDIPPSSPNIETVTTHTHNPRMALTINPVNSKTLNPKTPVIEEKTNLHHIVFGIAASKKLWSHRKKYIRLWWRPNQMRGYVWLDEPVQYNREDNNTLPPTKVSSDTSAFPYKHKTGDRSAIRISRIVSENLRLGLKDVRWFVMGDDDTFFVVENLVRVLEKYDHNQFYYIGATSESHIQNIFFSYNMGFGGGGFAISYPLAKALEKIQDKCIERYPSLYGSDDRIQACMAELGVPLTKEVGFHQVCVFFSFFLFPLSYSLSLVCLFLIVFGRLMLIWDFRFTVIKLTGFLWWINLDILTHIL